MLSKGIKLFLFHIVLGITVLNAAEIQVTDSDIQPGQTVTWTADNVYILNGFVFVDEGAKLYIEPGTVIKGQPGAAENASALIVARGGQIFAEGTRERPIIFTSVADDLSRTDDLPLDARGLWGGVIILGRAGLNSTPGETAIEGIPTTEPRGLYGGDNDADNSGVLRYVSVRYGGTDIGAGNEINGVTFGGVGSGTVVEYVEVVNNNDDGFEFFGGTVQAKYLVSAFNADDAFDYDEGFRGKGQFWFSLQAADKGNRGGEHDGGTSPEDGQPYATPVIANATYIGSGATSSNGKNDLVLKIRDNAGGFYYNSIFTDFWGRGVSVEDLASGEDSRARMEAGELVLANNIWYGFGRGNELDSIATQDFVREHLVANSNSITDPLLRGISRTVDNGLDPRPQAGSSAFSDVKAIDDPWFTQVDFRGAFGDDLWISGWTFLDEMGFVVKDVSSGVAGHPVASLPETIELNQNYPNPFNPSTRITYTLRTSTRTTLSVYNTIGQVVAVLVDEVQSAGRHELVWQADNLPSGVYFLQLMSEGYTVTRKMILAR